MMQSSLCSLLLAVFNILWLTLALAGEPQHGLALGTAVKYPPGFAHYAYADPQAVQGGVLTLSSPGSFDKLNPFSLKGRAPLLLSTLVFESLTDSSLDEPFAVYGLLADSIEVADDELSVTYHLNPRARFADGQPVTADDVVFSYTVLRSEAALPTYRAYYHDIATVEALARLTVRVAFARDNRDTLGVAFCSSVRALWSPTPPLSALLPRLRERRTLGPPDGARVIRPRQPR